MATSYDEVFYPSAVYSYTQPDLLAAIGILSGMKPAPIDRCRVLELGCGDGYNLIAMADGLPDSEFVGIDLAGQPIARGRSLVEKLGWKNVSLFAQDVTVAGPDLGQFDYIIAHGLYSWVPPAVREKVMEICGRQLSPQGIAYISYNAYPGNHFRDAARGMMRYHAAHFANPGDQVRQARGLVKLLAESVVEDGPYRLTLQRELERITKYVDAGFFHDDLSSNNQSFYFHEFMAQAQRHGLQYLGEADFTEKQEVPCAPQMRAVLAELDPKDVIGGEQYRDFVRGRSFRRTLLCREGIPLDRELSREGMSSLWISGEAHSKAPQSDLRSNVPEVFIGNKKSEFETANPVVRAALRRLGAVWPARISFEDLLAHVRRELGREAEEREKEDAAQLAGAMLQAAISGGLELHAHGWTCVTQPGEKPVASPLARMQIGTSSRVSTVMHTVVQIEDAMSRFLLTLLDGTRNRREICAALQAAVRDGQVEAPGMAPEQVDEAGLEKALLYLGRLGLLVA